MPLIMCGCSAVPSEMRLIAKCLSCRLSAWRRTPLRNSRAKACKQQVARRLELPPRTGPPGQGAALMQLN